MKTAIHSLGFFAAVLGGCLFSGDGTEGLPCNTDTECGGTQRCIEHVCGGPVAIATDVSIGGSSDESESSGDEAPMETNDDDDDVRTECEASETQCLDDDTLRLCTEDGKLSTRDCNGWCGQGAEHNGCRTDPNGQDTCYCLNSAQPCATEGEVQCNGDNITVCQDGYAVPADCDTICINGNFPAGVDYCGGTGDDVTCYCFEGSTCEEGAARCLDENNMQQCVGGTWQTYNCFTDLECPAGSYTRGCTYLDGDTESCACWSL